VVFRRGLCFVLAAFAGGASVASAGAGGVITQNTIGAAKLGLRLGQYQRALHEKPFTTRYGDGSERLVFAKAEISVQLGNDGRGAVISTAAPKYTLRGVGACAQVGKLAHVFRLMRVRVPGFPGGSSAYVYRAGHVWVIPTPAGTIGRIAIAASRPSLQALRSDSQCGTGEEEGSG
jgi:hypothetical protein